MIYYLAPHVDIAGGIKTLATHVCLLRRRGREAWLVNCDEPRAPWCSALCEAAPYTFPLSQFLQRKPSEGEILVVPEICPPFQSGAVQGLGRDVVLLILNWHYADIYWGARKVSDKRVETRPPWYRPGMILRRGFKLRRSLHKAGFQAIFTNSEFSRRWTRRRLLGDPLVVPSGVDTDTFYEDPRQRESNRILIVGTKNLREAEKAKAALLETPTLHLYHAVNLSEQQIAEQYRKSDIFLSFGKYEGFPRTVMEAMTSGCVVVGYEGGSGREIMQHGRTALLARREGDIIRYCRQLLVDPSRKEALRKEASRIISGYTLETQAQRLVEALDAVKRASAAGKLSLRTDLHAFFDRPGVRGHTP